MAWDRTHYSPGGGNALLYFVVPGANARELVVSRSRHRIESVPVELSVITASREASGLAAFLGDPVFATGLREALGDAAASIRETESAAVVRGEFKDPASLAYLRDTLGVIAALLESGGLAVLDAAAVRWRTPRDFLEHVLPRDDIDALDHVAFLRSESERGTWLHTRGLRKFGRPDLSVPDVEPSWEPAAVEMLSRLIWAQVRGHRIPDGQPVRMEGIPEGLVCRDAGSVEDPDFNNVHIRIAAAREVTES